MNKLILLRETLKEDYPFILSSFLQSFRINSATGKDISKAVYFANQERLISSFLERDNSLVLSSKEDPELIYGYILFSALRNNPNIIPVIHYIYVKAAYRKMGFCDLMLKAVKEYANAPDNIPMAVTHQTKDSKEYLKKYKFIYNPYLLGGY